MYGATQRVVTVIGLVIAGVGVFPAAVAAQGDHVGGGGDRYYLNDVFTGSANVVFSYGNPGDVVFFGDWDGDGVDSPLVRRGSVFFVRNSNSSGMADFTFSYGDPGDVVLTGDWDGDGVDTLAVRRGASYFVKNSVSSGVADVVISYGEPWDSVVVGDWDGDGVDTLAVRRETTFFVKDSISTGVADYTFVYGNPGDLVLVGDWDGSGSDTLAVRRGITYYLRNSTTSGVADVVFSYGNPTDTAFTGDWNGDHADTIGIRRPPDHPTWLVGAVTDISDVVPYSGRTDARNGYIAPSRLCLIPFMPSHYILCEALPDLDAFNHAYRARFGETLPIDTWDPSTYRSREDQEATWIAIGPPIAAPPGTSPHGWGLAVDMLEGPSYGFGSARYEWMLENGPRFGWQNMPWHWATGGVPEPWHFDYVR